MLLRQPTSPVRTPCGTQFRHVGTLTTVESTLALTPSQLKLTGLGRQAQRHDQLIVTNGTDRKRRSTSAFASQLIMSQPSRPTSAGCVGKVLKLIPAAAAAAARGRRNNWVERVWMTVQGRSDQLIRSDAVTRVVGQVRVQLTRVSGQDVQRAASNYLS